MGEREASENLVTRIATAWNRRKTRSDTSVASARAAVARLKPAVVITGGSRGIGEALARKFAEAGYMTVIVGRNAERLKAAADRIGAARAAQPAVIVCDVTAPDAFELLTRSLTDSGFYLDVLINNAGLGLSGRFIDQDDARLSDLIALNIASLTRLCRLALPDMAKRERGGVINIASLGAYAPGPYQAAYYASKAYVLSLTEALAAEYSGNGVRICAVAPGPVDTDFHADMGAEGANYRKVLPSLSARRVAQSVYFRFRFGQRVIIPGLTNRALSIILKVSPHPVSVPVVAWLLKTDAD
jgi:short-subunit dehydrogenase